jgi:cytidylate kinase
VVITVSNLYGSGAIAIAHLVAQRLDYEYVDEQLPVVVATRLMTSAAAVESAENTGKSMSERMLQALESGTPELRGQSGASFDEECLREVQEAVREYAAHGNAVIVGRGANAILGRSAGVLRVFLYAPRDWRVRHIMEGHAVDEKTAAAEVDRIDRARAEYMRIYYGVTWLSQENYDLCLDASVFGAEGCAQIIINAINAR